MPDRPPILVVEDDAAIRRGLVDALGFAGYQVVERARGKGVADLVCEIGAQLVLLDVMLPDTDGFTVLSQLRQVSSTVPVIMVTARGAEEDRVRGLTDGADDYVVKPFSAKELLARVEAVLRRSPERTDDFRMLRVHGRVIDLDRHEVQMPDGEVCRLTERETGVLRYLASLGGRTAERDELLHRVWGLNPQGITTRTVDMLIARLREKIEDDPRSSQIVLTVRGRGYMLTDAVEVVEP